VDLLTPRQAALFRLIDAGADNATIARRMGLSRHGVVNLAYRMRRRIGEFAT
jgi:DNA-binding CsgD family transcriptional regulator